MSITITILLCGLLLIAYLFDLTASKTRIPSVILLLALGWGVKEVTTTLKLSIPDLSPVLPFIGTIGLILIVLEGSLELEVNRSKKRLIVKSVLMSVLPLVILTIILGYGFYLSEEVSLRKGLINAIPLTIISSAIAIPSARHFSTNNREFITYESSLSDITGVILFNFIAANEILSTGIFGRFVLDLLIILLISIVSTVLLILLLRGIRHHVKFIPIILLIILIYAIAKVYHLPALVLILIFGLFLGNLENLLKYKLFQRMESIILVNEIQKFKEITTEIAFLIRSLFFLLFGFLIDTSEIINPNTLEWSVTITLLIFGLRAINLRILKLPLSPLLFISPRGLITILLFMSISAENSILTVNRSLIIQVIFLTSIIMMFGTFRSDINKMDESTDN